MKLTHFFVSLCFFCVTSATAQDDKTPEQELRESLAVLAPELTVTAIAESPLPGVYEVVSDGQIYYLTPDGRFMLEGSIIDLEQRVNLSEQRRGNLQMALITEVSEDQMIVFNNEAADATRWITVFTDTDCGYCQKLHREIETITDADIKVRYLMFPRAGMESASFRELQSVWCADDPLAAMTAAKTGGVVEEATCANPIQDHVNLATRVGLRGTPLIYLDNGTKIPGYRPANELIQMINESEPMAMK